MESVSSWLPYLQGLSVTAVIGGIALWLAWHRHVPEVARHLRLSADRRAAALAKFPGKRRWDQYRLGLGTILDRLDRLMGRAEPAWCPRWLAGLAGHLHPRGLLVGYWIALGYTFFSLLLAWVGGAETRLGDVVLLRDDPDASWAWRMLIVTVLVAILVTAGLAMGHNYRIEMIARHVSRRVVRPFPTSWQRPLELLLPRLAFGGIGLAWGVGVLDLSIPSATVAAISFSVSPAAGVAIGAVVVAGAIAGAGAGAMAISVTGAMAVVGAVVGQSPGAGATVVALLAFLFVAMLALPVPDVEIPGAGLLFLMILPWLNAIFDWLSWAVSRWLGRGLVALYDRQVPPPGAYVSPAPSRGRFMLAYAGHMALDLAAALALLAGLAWAMPAGIDTFNAFAVWLGNPAPLPLEAYLCSAAKAPWPQGAWAGAMLVSTLVPTILHLAALLMSPFAWLLRPSREQAVAAAALEARVALDHAAIGLAEKLDHQPGLTETEAHVLATYLVLRCPLAWLAGIAGAAICFVALWALVTFAWQPLPQLLLWIARGDSAVASCFGG